MSLKNNSAQGGVSSVDNLSGSIELIQGPGMMIVDNASTNTIQFSTITQASTLDTVLFNGNQSARTVELLKNPTDLVPTLTLHDSISLGNSTQIPDVNLSYTNETPSGIKLNAGKILRSDIIGATAAPAIQSKSGISLDPGLTLKSDNIAPSTSGSAVHINKLELDIDSTIYVDNIRPNPVSPTRFITTGGLAVDPTYGIKCAGYLPSSAADLNATAFLADSGTISSLGVLTLYPDTNVKVYPNKPLLCDNITSSTTATNALTINTTLGSLSANDILLNPTNSVSVQSGKPIKCDQIVDTTNTKMGIDFNNAAIQASKVILQSDTQIQNFYTTTINPINETSTITLNAPTGGVILNNNTVLNTDTIHAVNNEIGFTSNVKIDPKLNLNVKSVVSDSDILLNPVGDVVVDPAKILKTVNIRSISDVIPITMSSDVNIGSFGTDSKTLNTDHIRPLTLNARTDMGSTTISDLAAGVITPSVGGMTIDMNKASITSATIVEVAADLKATSLTTDAINTSTPNKLSIDLLTSTISSLDGVTVSNVTSQDTRFSSITPISKALALNGDIKMLQDATIYTDKLAASVAQNITINSDTLINNANKLTASTIESTVINPAVVPYGLKLLLDESTISAGNNITFTPNDLLKIYGKLQCDEIQPLTIGGDITLVTAVNAFVNLGSVKVTNLRAFPNNDLNLITDSGQYVKATAIRTDSIAPSVAASNLTIFGNVTTNPKTVVFDSSGIVFNNSISPNTGEIKLNMAGLRFGTGNALLNNYEENNIYGYFAGMLNLMYLRFVKVGNMVTITAPSAQITKGSTTSVAFTPSIIAKYRNSYDIAFPIFCDNGTAFLKLTSAGDLSVTLPASPSTVNLIISGSYAITPAVTGASGQIDPPEPEPEPQPQP